MSTQTVHMFDLDRTIWDTYDVFGRPIWAKQMLRPFTMDGNKITDDVGSICVLRENIHEYMKYLKKQGHDLGFMSVGAAWSLTEEDQPSINLLKDFGLYDFFGSNKYLKYKTTSKNHFLENISNCVFYDDDEKHLLVARQIPGLICHNCSEVKDWSSFYE